VFTTDVTTLTAPRNAALVVALAVTGFSMRTAVTSVGSALDEIESGLHTSSGVAGLLTTMPVVCFAALGWITPAAAARFGPHRVLQGALAVATAGTVLRAFAPSIWTLLALSVLALAGGAVANVLLPSLVKLHFPDRIGAMTAVYTTGLALGTTAAAGLTVPIGDLGDGWRLGIGGWALFAAVAIVPWLPTLRREIRPAPEDRRTRRVSLARSRTAWVLTGFFAAQSGLAYIGFGWMARFMHAHGVSESTAGWMVALMSAIGIPVSMVVPLIPPRRHRALVLALSASFVVCFLGLGLAPVGGAWIWMIAYGIGNGFFPLVLTMIGLRSRTPATTAALSAFAQAIGYLIAGTGPVLFGVLYGQTGSWVLPLGLMWLALALATVSGWFACVHRYVDDEVEPARLPATAGAHS
jgi:CP family cyanate transporter-like MFS transporter